MDDDGDLPLLSTEVPECPELLADHGSLSKALGASEGFALKLVEKLAAAHDDAALERKSFSDCQYMSCKAAGVSLRLEPPGPSGRVNVVFLYAGGVDGFSAYMAASLPTSLSWEHTAKDVVQLLGEPTDKFGGGRLQVGIAYELLGLDVQFRGCSWDDASNRIAFLSIYPPVGQTHGLCARCAKRAELACSRCGRCTYCSSDCQKQDWARHKDACDVLRGGPLVGQLPTCATRGAADQARALPAVVHGCQHSRPVVAELQAHAEGPTVVRLSSGCAAQAATAGSEGRPVAAAAGTVGFLCAMD